MTKTTTISSSGSLSGLSDCVLLTSVVNGNLWVNNSATSKWINTDSILDNLLFVYDDSDNTKKMQFQSGITACATRVNTIPDAQQQ